jgi:hypothetical protein
VARVEVVLVEFLAYAVQWPALMLLAEGEGLVVNLRPEPMEGQVLS